MKAENKNSLLDENERTTSGAYYTPEVYVRMAHNTISHFYNLEEMYIWDCSAGTGNLLIGLDQDRVFASTNELIDVEIMKSRGIKNVFQFDFLNDSFDSLPEELRKIIKDSPEKLILLNNPPYHSVGKGGSKNRLREDKSVAAGKHNSLVYNTYSRKYGKKCMRELYIQFLIRIYEEIKGCKIATFSKIKHLTYDTYECFRCRFQPNYLYGWMFDASEFEHVREGFPILFSLMDSAEKNKFQQCCPVVYRNGEPIGARLIEAIEEEKMWHRYLRDIPVYDDPEYLWMETVKEWGRTHHVHFSDTPTAHANLGISKENFDDAMMYYAYVKTKKVDWIDGNSLIEKPSNELLSNIEFQNDCIIWTMLSGVNDITREPGYIANLLLSDEAERVRNSYYNLLRYCQDNFDDFDVTISSRKMLEYVLGFTNKKINRFSMVHPDFNALLDVHKTNIMILGKKIQKRSEYGNY